MRLPWPAVAGGVLVAAMGAAGLVRGSMTQAAEPGPSAAGPIVVTNAYVRPPVAPSTNAAAYFTVYNTTGSADRLISVETGAGTNAVLHLTRPDGSMVMAPQGAVVPAHGSLTLRTGEGHVMIEHVIGTLKPGQRVDLELDFENAGPIDIVAPVVALGSPAPTGGHS
jgi:copper(I)-binding protein